jgi:ATP-binding cassette subfamily B protein
MGYTRAYRRQFFLVAGLSLLDMGLSAQFSLSFKYLIDRGIIQRDQRMLFLILAGLAISVPLVTATGTWRDRRYARIACQFTADLRSRLFAHLQRLSISFYKRAHTSNLSSRLSSDLSDVEKIFLQLVSRGILPLMDILLSTVLVFALDWRMAIIAMAAFPLSLAGPLYLSPRTAAAAQARKHEESGLVHAVRENIAAQAVVKAYGLEPSAIAAFEIRNAALLQAGSRLGFLSFLMGRSAVFSVQILQLLVLAMGGYLAFAGSMTIGTLAAFQAIFGTLASSLGLIADYLPQIVRSGSSMARIERLLAEEPQITDARDAAALPRFSSAIEFRSVSFAYPGAQQVLEDVNFRVVRGTSAAIVGPSGSGKSTILNLLMRIYDPSGGSILVEGRDLRSVTQESFRAQMAAVLQESFLFHTTIRNNIRAGRASATDEEVEHAAREAEIHDFIMSLPDGYESLAGEGYFSTGQRQRLALARALLRNPEILILDEVTSALDSATESLINQTIERAAKGRTLLSVTHRLGSVQTADVILFLERGRIVETGTHADLLARNGIYARMWRKQSGFAGAGQGEGWRIEPQWLRDIPILSELDDTILGDLAGSFYTEVYSAHHFLVHEGDPGDKFYILARGTAEVRKREGRVAVLQDGDFFGEMALILNTPRSASVRALTECTCLTLPREKFQALMSRAPSLRWRLRELAAINEHVYAEAAVPMAPAATLASSKIRHDLLTPINHLVGYSELLLEDLPESAPVQAILEASKTSQRMIEEALPSGQAVTRAGLEALRRDLETPLQAILASVAQQAQTHSPVSVEADLEKIRSAAGSLRGMFDGMDQPARAIGSARRDSDGSALAAFRESSAGHLLVVDDNDRGRELLCRRLGRHGYRVSQAAGGREALEMIASDPFDLVLLDVLMPEVDGYEVLRQLKAMGRLQELSVIMTTAMDEMESAVRCIELGAEDYLTKPIDPVLLETRIGNAVARKRAREEERRKVDELRAALHALQEEKGVSAP